VNIGILGGGQLSRMLALAGMPLGLTFHFYFPKAPHSLQSLGKVMHGEYDDLEQLDAFANQVDVITFENENIPTDVIVHLKKKTPVFPDENALAVSQDRLLEKRFFLKNAIPTNRFIEIHHRDDIDEVIEAFGFPFILKKRTHGYDGKGQVKINGHKDVAALPTDYFHHVLAEEFVHFDREVSLIMAVNAHGSVSYDVCENTHRHGILIKTQNKKQDAIFDLALDYLTHITRALNYVGVLAVEFFQVGDRLLANEMAPRVHNSGHWTIDACVTSQFENHLRAIAGFALGSPQSVSEAVMLNMIGKMPDRAALLGFPKLCLHDYEKEPRVGRKLGHVTLLDEKDAVVDEVLGLMGG